ncbi:putative transposase [Deinococcus humi]|uniref:Putative transposase n=1 Tax=Deinococcus humi TaxID=662880 RepID=A0A7W8JXL2_9DEIO|nr:putative transposase [Deinococcus humi]
MPRKLSHRFPLSDRDRQALLQERGLDVSHDTLGEWNVDFSPLSVDERRYREPRRGSRWYMDEGCPSIGGVRHWLWRAVDEHGAVLNVLLQEHRNTEAAKSFFDRLLGRGDVPELIHTDELWSDGAALRESLVLHGVEHVQVVSTARHNNPIEQSHRPTWRQERQQRGFRSRQRAQGFFELHARITNLHHPARSTVPALWRRHQQAAFTTWRETVWQAA